ncbi:MAG: hypothetical protein JWR17_5081 [Pseudomonas sp.]|uniref:DUF6555 family protein n=1 Tax=Pseudomonas sp. TaxID=306 RepID=UPI002636E223|nr:DUF6555 family protein [Pseudomonas sp.]MDB6052335.1 hypothetical protein [Pseudomonas sp.]
MDGLKVYEIHYLHHGVKKVILHHAEQMTDFDAWILAAIECGLPQQILPVARFLTVAITTAEGQGITKVRWNICPRSGGLDRQLKC